MSNPGNSGGPVFDSDGKLLGLLRGNFPSPVKDESQRFAEYVRPMRDANGNPVLGADGKQQFEIAKMYQNSGISVVVPAYFVQKALDQAQGKISTTPTQGSLVIQGVEVINEPPDVVPKVASSLSIAELGRQMASFLVTFRTFLSQQEALERQLSDSLAPALPNATREDREAAAAKLGKQWIALQNEMKDQYHAKFKAEAKRLRDDSWARLPIAARDKRSVLLYDYPPNLVALRRLADDLERLSRVLAE